ncbi:hypothetical protein D3C83_93160 [compost metagenome]
MSAFRSRAYFALPVASAGASYIAFISISWDSSPNISEIRFGTCIRLMNAWTFWTEVSRPAVVPTFSW